MEHLTNEFERYQDIRKLAANIIDNIGTSREYAIDCMVKFAGAIVRQDDDTITVSDLKEIKDELKNDIKESELLLKSEMKESEFTLKNEMKDLKAEMYNMKADIIKWVVGLVLIQSGFITILKIFG